MTELIRAVKSGDEQESLRVLKSSHSQIDRPDDSGQTALFHASTLGMTKVVRALLEAEANINKADKQKTTPLMVAVRRGHEEVFEVLMEYGADVNLGNFLKETPLLLAFKHRRYHLAKRLVEEGANTEHTDKHGNTPYTYAEITKDSQLFRILDKVPSASQVAESRYRIDLQFGNKLKSIYVPLAAFEGMDVTQFNNCVIVLEKRTQTKRKRPGTGPIKAPGES